MVGFLTFHSQERHWNDSIYTKPMSGLCSGPSIPVEVPRRKWRSEPSVWPPAGGCSQPTLPAQPAITAHPDQPVTGRVTHMHSSMEMRIFSALFQVFVVVELMCH